MFGTWVLFRFSYVSMCLFGRLHGWWLQWKNLPQFVFLVWYSSCRRYTLFVFPPFFFVRLNLYIELLRILSLIVFFTFVSIFVNALGLDDAHYKVECSNMGTCDKTKGECKCRTNFEGKKTKLTHGSLYTNREQQAINTQHLSNTSLPFLWSTRN